MHVSELEVKLPASHRCNIIRELSSMRRMTMSASLFHSKCSMRKRYTTRIPSCALAWLLQTCTKMGIVKADPEVGRLRPKLLCAIAACTGTVMVSLLYTFWYCNVYLSVSASVRVFASGRDADVLVRSNLLVESQGKLPMKTTSRQYVPMTMLITTSSFLVGQIRTDESFANL
jgi:hypothetical protein